MPSKRTVARRAGDTVEVYSFPASATSGMNHYATVGVSASGRERSPGALATWEFCIVTPPDNAGTSDDRVTSLLLDVMSYSLRSDTRVVAGETIPPSLLLPEEWNARALLIDDPRGEPEWLANVHVGVQHVRLLWLVPIHADERTLILEHGIDAFDEAEAASEWSLADPKRPSFLVKS
ncbi:MAG: suppressor of fused domain protein [Planctomycetota bacterium]|nr:suppressor of fused domain protein [Planctomycetota bacterium]